MKFRKLTGTAFPMYGAVSLIMAACSSEPVGLDSAQMAEQWQSPSSSSGLQASTASTIADVEEFESPEAEVTTAFEDIMAARVQCGRRPEACDVSELAVNGSAVHAKLSALIADRIAAGITASESGAVRYRIDSVSIVAPDEALVETCLYDDTVLVIDGAIYDDSVYSSRSEWTLSSEQGQWRWSEERIEEWSTEEDLCVGE